MKFFKHKTNKFKFHTLTYLQTYQSGCMKNRYTNYTQNRLLNILSKDLLTSMSSKVNIFK